MIHRPPVIPALLALLVLPSAAHAGRETWREQSDYVRDAKGFATVRVENARGEVSVHASTDGRIHVRGLKLSRASSQSEARRLADETIVEIDESGRRLAIFVRYPKHAYRLNLWQDFSGVVVPDDEVRLAIELPPDRTLTLVSASGDLASDGMRGAQDLRSASGDISLTNAAGAVVIRTASGDVSGHGISAGTLESTSGDVELDGPLGALRIGTTSGDVVVRDAGDSLSIGTVSGDVRVTRAARGLTVTSTSGTVTVSGAGGVVRASTVSGDLEIGVSEQLRRADVGTQSGSLSVALDPALAATLTLASSSGELEVSDSIRETRRSRRELLAEVRGGGVPVDLHSSSGDISVSVGGH